MSPTSAEFGEILRDCFDKPEDTSRLERLDRFLRPRLLAILVAIYRRDPSPSEDAYHSAFIRYIKILKQGPKTGINYEAYFVAVAKHCLIDEIRKTSRFVPFDRLVDEELADAQFKELDKGQARLDLLQAISRLEARCRFILQSHYIEGMPTPELARRLKIHDDSVYMALKRCRDHLRQAFTTR
jgi:RNA polymerase sigma factor (sigma-70 family)